MPLILPGNVASATASTTYNIDKSCRFNSASSSQLKRTAGTATDPEKYTFSCWVKRGSFPATNMQLIATEPNGSEREWLFFVDTNQWLKYMGHISPTASKNLITTQRFRDPAAWYHVVLTYDSAQAVAANRTKLYVNGTQITDLSGDSSTAAYVIQNADSPLNTSGNVFCVGANWNYHSGGYAEGFYNGYMAEVFFCDGQALAPTSFGEFNSDSPTIWQPIDCSGDLTFGDNGFYLNFSDSADLGADSSGNSNDFTVTNLAAIDQTTDTPTNNFCTINPLDAVTQTITLSEGNCKMVASGGADDKDIFSTFGITAGKWYWEVKTTTVGERNWLVVSDQGESNTKTTASDYGSNYALLRGFDGAITTSATENSEPGSALNDDDVACFAFDADNGQLWVSDSANIDITGTANVTGLSASRTYHISYSHVGNSPGSTNEFNFGNPVAAPASANADGNGYGSFEYAPPSGYLALCTKNLGSDGG